MPTVSITVPLQHINDFTTREHGINLYILRTDLNHPHISGNKPYKLKYNLQEAALQQKKTILTFGGAFSNHIAATAAAGKEYGLKTIGIIRGEQYNKLNPTLQFATDCGMLLHYVPRNLYQDRTELMKLIRDVFPVNDIYTIPEGGANELGIKGCKEIISSVSIPFDYIAVPCGTGTTMAGIVLSLTENQQALGFQVLKAENYIQQEVSNWLSKVNKGQNPKQTNWLVNENYHFGGYAKTNNKLLHFIKEFEQQNNIPLDYIYTGKMMYGIYDLMNKGYFPKGKTVIVVHTGGLQGNAGFNYRTTSKI